MQLLLSQPMPTLICLRLWKLLKLLQLQATRPVLHSPLQLLCHPRPAQLRLLLQLLASLWMLQRLLQALGGKRLQAEPRRLQLLTAGKR